MVNKIIARIIAVMPENLVWVFSKRYIAGTELSDAVRIVKTLNVKGITATIDILGEYIKKLEEAIFYKEEYLKSIDIIKREGLQTTVSVKPSMFGLLLDKNFCLNQLEDVVKKAELLGISVCMDMEDSSCTQDELYLFEVLYKKYPATISMVLQAYLKRTFNDLKWLKSIMKPEYPINIRLCKGIYVEPEEVAYIKHNDINKNFIKCISYMLENGFFSAIATHDRKLVKAINNILHNKRIAKQNYEYQMLYGVRPALRDKLVALGHNMRIYVPYGTHWYGYSTRRLKENPRMITHIFKALIFRG